MSFFFNDTATTEIYTLSLHDALPISTKGPRLTGEISFAGRYLVLIPFGDKVNVSSKIKSGEERARLKQLINSIKPNNFGVIVRTVAQGKRVAELDAEMKVLRSEERR